MPTRWLGQHIIFHERIGSTNDTAKQLADAGAPAGTVVIADEQTAGRGRMGRTWVAPPHSSLLMSLILRPTLEPAQASRITMAVALGACEAIHAATGLDAQIKWSNDILVRGKKLAGILIESGILGNRLEYVIAGIGVNVNFNAASVAGIPPEATTIADELGRTFSRVALAQAMLISIEKFYARIGTDLRDEFSKRLATLNQLVRAQTPSGIVEGIAEAVNENGALIVRRADGTFIELIAGEVTLTKTPGG